MQCRDSPVGGTGPGLTRSSMPQAAAGRGQPRQNGHVPVTLYSTSTTVNQAQAADSDCGPGCGCNTPSRTNSGRPGPAARAIAAARPRHANRRRRPAAAATVTGDRRRGLSAQGPGRRGQAAKRPPVRLTGIRGDSSSLPGHFSNSTHIEISRPGTGNVSQAGSSRGPYGHGCTASTILA
jgi:hypothetical protein